MDCTVQPQPSSPPSSPLSVLSQSPSPPPSPSPDDAFKRYPSPSSSSTPPPGCATPMKPPEPAEIRVRTDGPPPPKRRKIAAPRPRTTEYVDLENVSPEDEAQLDRLLSALRKKKKIVVIAGAGISVSAGIPDFRSSTGLFSTLRGQHKMKASGKHLFDASVYKHDSSTSSFHSMVRELAQLTSEAQPTPFHHMLASIAEEGRLMRLYSQNIDCIDTRIPPLATNVPLDPKGPFPTTIQLHGSLDKMVCGRCGDLKPFNSTLFDGPEPPPCSNCEDLDLFRLKYQRRSLGIGRMRPRIVLYNEYNPDEDAIGNVSQADLRRAPDAVVVVGTSLKIPGVRRLAKELCQVTRSKKDGLTAWINLDSEPQSAEFRDCWDLVVRGRCDDIAELASLPRWDEQDIGVREAYMVTGDERKETLFRQGVDRDRLDVLLSTREATTETKSKIADLVRAGIPTPTASPRFRSPLPAAKQPAKTKQSKLAFGDGSAAAAESSRGSSGPPAAKRKRGRPRKAGANARPNPPKKNDLTKTFKATKQGVSAVIGGRELEKEPKKEPSPDPPPSSPRDDDGKSVRSLPGLRPVIYAAPLTPYYCERGSTPGPRPSTPTANQGECSSHHTISPSSKPKFQHELLD